MDKSNEFYTYEGIPTFYKGIKFRSRLEAKWAMFFDLMGWKWEYEPIDLPGWIPDFIIYGKDEEGNYAQILVEVKPFISMEDFDIEKYSKIQEKDKREILLLGQKPFEDEDNIYSFLGWLLEIGGNYCESCFNNYNNIFGFYSRYGSFRDRITGLYEGDHFCSYPEFEIFEQLWRECCNKLRWEKNGNL